MMDKLVDVLLKAKRFARNTLVVFDDVTRTVTISVVISDEEAYEQFKRLYEAIRMMVR